MDVKMTGERQMRKTLNKNKPNHLERYLWAIRELKRLGVSTVLDAACGAGYGSYMLANAGFKVHAVDVSLEAIAWAKMYYNHPHIIHTLGDILTVPLAKYDAVVSIETIEHVDESWIDRIESPIIVGTVPNEDVVPFSKKSHPFHLRHYTKSEFDALMPGRKRWFTQYDAWDLEGAKMRPGDDGMTLGAVCER